MEDDAETQVEPHAVSIALDAGYDHTNFRFTTLSMIVVNGAPPSDYLRSEPYDAAAYSTALHVYEPYTDRETVAFGFNDTRRPRCQQELDDDVYIALRCVHPVGPDPGPCGYNLTATLVPLTLRHGDEFDAYLAPATTTTEPARHYYHIAVSAFEQLAVSINARRPTSPSSTR